MDDFGFDGDDELSESFINEYDSGLDMDSEINYFDDEELDDKLSGFNLPSDIDEYNPTDDDLGEFNDEFDDEFDDMLGESDDFEIELDEDEMLDEKPMTQSIGANRRAGKMSQTRKRVCTRKKHQIEMVLN